jgi:hypothetical protein
MKRAIMAGAVVASLVLAGPAGAATPAEKKLQRQVVTLQKDVKKLKTQVTELNEILNVLAAITFCSTAITADALQGTWATIDTVEGRTVIGPQQAVNDAGACQALQVARTTASPPSLTAFHSLMRILAFRSLF